MRKNVFISLMVLLLMPSIVVAKQYNSNFEITDEFIRNMPDLDTRTYRFEFPDGTTGYGTKTEFDRIMKEKYTFGFIKIGDKWFYKNTDGTFKSGWYKSEANKWYYFDPIDFAAEVNSIKEIDGNTYYFNNEGVMETSKKITVNGIDIFINEDGTCLLNQPDNFVTKEEIRDQFISNDDNYTNARIVGNADGVTHITVSSIGQLYIAYPTLYLSTGEVFNEFGENMERYITSQMPTICVEVNNKLKENNNDPYTPFTIKNYEITNVQDGVIYFKAESPILTINRQERKQRNFNIIFNFAYVIKTGIINTNYKIV